MQRSCRSVETWYVPAAVTYVLVTEKRGSCCSSGGGCGGACFAMMNIKMMEVTVRMLRVMLDMRSTVAAYDLPVLSRA